MQRLGIGAHVPVDGGRHARGFRLEVVMQGLLVAQVQLVEDQAEAGDGQQQNQQGGQEALANGVGDDLIVISGQSSGVLSGVKQAGMSQQARPSGVESASAAEFGMELWHQAIDVNRNYGF
ncbi:hypothetical protein D3C75_1067280 [compost metagenome]